MRLIRLLDSIVAVKFLYGTLSELEAKILLQHPGAKTGHHGPEASYDGEDLPKVGRSDDSLLLKGSL